MLRPEKVEEVRQAHDKGLSLRQVARQTGVSRGSVVTIVRGRWHGRRAKKPTPPEDEPRGPVGTCPECHCTVDLPCRACRARTAKATGRPRSAQRDPPDGPSLDLRGDHRLRYEQVRCHPGGDEAAWDIFRLDEMQGSGEPEPGDFLSEPEDRES